MLKMKKSSAIIIICQFIWIFFPFHVLAILIKTETGWHNPFQFVDSFPFISLLFFTLYYFSFWCLKESVRCLPKEKKKCPRWNPSGTFSCFTEVRDIILLDETINTPLFFNWLCIIAQSYLFIFFHKFRYFIILDSLNCFVV